MFWRKKKKYNFYLCGPMRGYPDLNNEMFTLAANLLRSKGFTVWNPAEHATYLELSFAECMQADLDAVVNRCRKIATLPGWRDSLGANAEVFCAFMCGNEVLEICIDCNRKDFELVSVNLTEYSLPYQQNKTTPFNPHKCDLYSFDEVS